MSSYVYIKNPNGRTYVYENTTYWDRETKTCKHKRVSIGHLDPDTKKIVPKRKKGDAARKRAASVSEKKEKCCVEGIGISLLFDKIAHQTEVKAVLQNIFRDDWSRILTCAYYPACEGDSLCHLDTWMERNRTLYDGSMATQRISELLVRITPSL